ncbi:MAG: single-stranded DNA-binding protein [Demequina sp.]
MNDLTMTVSGWVATDPKQHIGPSGVTLVSFRLASTPRYYDRTKGEWTDGQTEWFSVRAFKHASVTIAKSIKKGQPVTVHGRFRTHEWESDSGLRTDLVLDAITVGHDLTRGTAEFVRAIVDDTRGEEGSAAPEGADAGSGEATGDDSAEVESAPEKQDAVSLPA